MTTTASVQTPAHFTFASGWEFKLGIAASVFTTLIWSGFFIAMRAGATSALTSFDLALLRYGPAAVLLFPFFLKEWRRIMATPKILLLGILVGAGVPFFYLCSWGAAYSPASHAGLIITGMTPLFIALIAIVIFKEKFSKQKTVGVACIGLGITALLTLAFIGGNTEYWKGDLIFLIAAVFWTVFSVCFRMIGLPPLAIAGFLSLVSTVVLLMLYALGIVQSGFADTPVTFIVSQALIQSVCAGLLAGFSYGYAINKIGAERSSAIGSLAPVFVGLAAAPLLGEQLTQASLLGMILVCFGVLLASGIKIPMKTTRKQ
ncbi:DMT family transporter [Marinomonas balearica]|uniref:EamA-like transporter family protein n=1 Tax=Marinomonas balearica TaxID=491947 RepID=A0A4R6M779_9GAMM|nr:DMT family transporter [Marinomonas balearica]TDO97257.1 EamA-like transporter family protein [Marinomonas balearica]